MLPRRRRGRSASSSRTPDGPQQNDAEAKHASGVPRSWPRPAHRAGFGAGAGWNRVRRIFIEEPSIVRTNFEIRLVRVAFPVGEYLRQPHQREHPEHWIAPKEEEADDEAGESEVDDDDLIDDKDLLDDEDK